MLKINQDTNQTSENIYLLIDASINSVTVTVKPDLCNENQILVLKCFSPTYSANVIIDGGEISGESEHVFTRIGEKIILMRDGYSSDFYIIGNEIEELGDEFVIALTILQQDEDNPFINILSNTIDPNITCTRIDAGRYKISSEFDVFTEGKTEIYINPSNEGNDNAFVRFTARQMGNSKNIYLFTEWVDLVAGTCTLQDNLLVPSKEMRIIVHI